MIGVVVIVFHGKAVPSKHCFYLSVKIFFNVFQFFVYTLLWRRRTIIYIKRTPLTLRCTIFRFEAQSYSFKSIKEAAYVICILTFVYLAFAILLFISHGIHYYLSFAVVIFIVYRVPLSFVIDVLVFIRF